MRLLHDKGGMTARFLTDVYEAVSWTVIPTDSSSTGSHLSYQAIQYGFFMWVDGSSHSFTQLVSTADTNTYFCVNFPKTLQNRIHKELKESPTLAMQPFFIDILILIELLVAHRTAIAKFRSELVAIVRILPPQPSHCPSLTL